MRKRAARVGRKVLLAALSALAGLALVEGWFRAFHPVEYRRPVPPRDEQEWMGFVHRQSEVPGLDYELKPSFEGAIAGLQIRTNSLGQRDDEPAPPGSAGLLRIAAVGDSVTFGMWVAPEEAWPNALESLLNRRGAASGRRYEVQNFGVTGYSARNEARVVESKALPSRPDLVIVGYYLNDPETEPVQQLQQYFRRAQWWEHFLLFRFFSQQRRIFAQRRLGGGDVLRYLHADPESWQTVPRAFADIARSAEAAGSRVLVVVLPTLYGFERFDAYPYAGLHRQVVAAAREQGLHAFDALPAWLACGKDPRDLRSDLDHPNAIGHAILAQAIAQEIAARHRELLGVDE